MAYVTPTTRADGYVVPASVWNSDVVDNPIALKALIDALPSVTDNAICEGRLTLTTGVPVTTADVTAATTLYWSPYKGNRIALYTGSVWVLVSQAQLSIAVPATTSQMYDVFVDYNGGTPVLAVTAWTNDTTRATALTTQDGVLVQTGNLDWRYVGSFRTTTVSGQTEDSFAKRYVWNYYNRVRRSLRRLETTSTWSYTTATFRQANASTSNQLDIVVGVAEAALQVSVNALVSNSSAGVDVQVTIGEDSTSAGATGCLIGYLNTPGATHLALIGAALSTVPAIGYHYYAWLERSIATGTTTWYGASAGVRSSGIHGIWEG